MKKNTPAKKAASTPTPKRSRDADTQASNSGEFKGSPKMGVALISGVTFAQKSVVYYEVNGIAIVEGDIALGTVDAVAAVTNAVRDTAAVNPAVAFGVGVTGSQFRWPNCRVPYEIDPNLPNQQRVTDAIAHWETNTLFRFPLRTAANAAQHPNYIRFTDEGGCWSMVGMQAGQQTISLGTGCSTGNAIHEIGHAIGLWHEQSREDRDSFVTINWQNIQSGMAAQFNQHIVDGDDWGTYDYGSIMHYPRTAFSRNGQDTIVPTDPNAQIGQRNGLSPGDITAVRAMYPGCGPIKSPHLDAAPFKKVRDDFPAKRLRDDRGFKKLRDDLVAKPVRDPLKPIRDPGPVKIALDPMPPLRPDIGMRPGALQPFAIATPHHAALAAAGLGYGAGMDPTGLEQQMLDLEAATAEARAIAAQANADIARLQQASDTLASVYEQAMGQPGGGT